MGHGVRDENRPRRHHRARPSRLAELSTPRPVDCAVTCQTLISTLTQLSAPLQCVDESRFGGGGGGRAGHGGELVGEGAGLQVAVEWGVRVAEGSGAVWYSNTHERQ